MQYKFTRAEIEEVIQDRLKEIQQHSYFDGIIVSFKPTMDSHDYVCMRGELTQLVEMTAKLITFITQCVKEINPDASDESIIQDIVNRTLLHKTKTQNTILKKATLDDETT